jgi:hypothetical protein
MMNSSSSLEEMLGGIEYVEELVLIPCESHG